VSALLLDIRDLAVHLPLRPGPGVTRHSVVRAVDGVSLTVKEGEVLGLVGESGCGKSTLARAVMGLVPATRGQVLFQGSDATRATGAQLRAYRRGLQMVFQDPYASLNPRLTLHATLAEPLKVHGICPESEIPSRVAGLLELVGLSPAQARRYPHEFSGGQRQRIAIARALAVGPRMIVADEPVSALDVSIQAQILNLLGELCRRMNLALLFIAHDLSVVRHVSDRVAVMYLGRIVELGTAEEVIDRPRHPYTRALVSAIPVADPDAVRPARTVLSGEPASPLSAPQGCAFAPRCPHAVPQCRAAVPALAPCGEAHEAACIRLSELPPA
jgi:oligopeptide transport system ATP-binding protein